MDKMKKIVNTVALLAVSGTFAMAGGHIRKPIQVLEPVKEIPKKEVVVVTDNVKYDGFYLGGALSYMSMNEAVLSKGYALTLLGGYYFNKYFGIEGRYTRTITDVDIDAGATTTSAGDILSNIGLYLKPMYNITTGFSLYGLAGYGKSSYKKAGVSYSESGAQWGLGAKYELANGVGLFFDYLELSSGDIYDGIAAQNILFNTMSVGATYTF
jgi:hypothetical protein